MDWIQSRVDWLRERYARGDVSAVVLTRIYNNKFNENRTLGAIQFHIRGIHSKKYTQEQKDWLMSNKSSYSDLSYRFNKKFGTYRTEQALRQQMMILNREKKRKGEET